ITPSAKPRLPQPEHECRLFPARPPRPDARASALHQRRNAKDRSIEIGEADLNWQTVLAHRNVCAPRRVVSTALAYGTEIARRQSWRQQLRKHRWRNPHCPKSGRERGAVWRWMPTGALSWSSSLLKGSVSLPCGAIPRGAALRIGSVTCPGKAAFSGI